MKVKPSWKWFPVGILFLSFALGLFVALSPSNRLLNWYNTDDAFYYFKVAANVTSGRGLTFDGLHLTNGFHPLWMLVCISIFWLARFDLFLPLRILVMVSMLLNGGIGIMIFRLLRRFLSPIIAATTAIIWMFQPLIRDTIVMGGLETVLSIFLLAWLLVLVVSSRGMTLRLSRMLLLGLVAGLAVLARLDTIFIVALLGAWFVLGGTTGYLRNVVVGDLALICASGFLSYYLRLHSGSIYAQNAGSLPVLVGIGFVVKPLVLFLFGLYRPGGIRPSRGFFGRSLLAVSLSSAITGALLLFLQWVGVLHALPRSVIAIDWAIMLAGILLVRLLFGFLHRDADQTGAEPTASKLNKEFWRAAAQRATGYFAPLVLLVGGYMLWSYLWVGMPMPVSGEIKHWWGTLPNPAYGQVSNSVSALLGVEKYSSSWELVFQPLYAAEDLAETCWGPAYKPAAFLVAGALLLILASVVIYPSRKWAARQLDDLALFVLFIGLNVHILSFTSTTYLHIRAWYWASEFLFTILCLGILLEGLLSGLRKLKVKPQIWPWVYAVISVGFAVLSIGSLGQEFSRTASGDPVHEYLTGAALVEQNTEPGSRIGALGGGTFGYFVKDRTIVNLDGLISSPEYFEALKQGRGTAILDQAGLDYVLGRENMLLAADPYMGMFADRLIFLKAFPGGGKLYQYVQQP